MTSTNSNSIIQRATFDMFRNWTKVAAEKYPDMDFTIKDETELVNDTKDAISKALKSLFLPEKEENRQNTQWCIGYVEGYILGCVSVKWHSNYIFTQTDSYRCMMALQSILEYVKVDSNLSWRLDNIYKELLKPTNLEQLKNQTQIDVDFFQKLDHFPDKKSGVVIQTLDNLRVTFIKKQFNEPSLDIPEKEYFSHKEIQSFIEKWKEKSISS